MKRNNLNILLTCLSILILSVSFGCARQSMNGSTDTNMESAMEEPMKDSMETMNEEKMEAPMGEMPDQEMDGKKDEMKDRMMK